MGDWQSSLFSLSVGFLVLLGGGFGKAEEDDLRREMHLYLKGRYIFQKQCAICHGTTGRGDGPWAAELEDKPRNFRSGLYKFRTTPFGMLPVEEDLRRTIRSGISGTAMPVFKDLTDDDVDALIVFLQSLSRSWRKEENEAESIVLPETPGWFSNPEQRAYHAKRGMVAYSSSCAVCHGESGDGDGPGAEGLKDFWASEIRPAKLSEPHHKSGDRPIDLYRTIATGMNGTPMVGFVEAFSEEEIWDLVAVVLSFAKKESSTAGR